MHLTDEYRELLTEYFRRRGCIKPQVDIPEDLLEQVDLVLQDANNLLAFRIFRSMVYSTAEFRVMIEEELLKATKLTEFFDKVYLVIPDTYIEMARSVLSGKVLDEIGIGVVAIDESGNVEELLVPRPAKFVRRRIGEGVEEIIGDLKKKINEIELFYSSLKKEIGVLSERVERIEQSITVLREEISGIRRGLAIRSTTHESTETVSRKEVTPIGELPSFARNNPWLDLLRKRERR